MNTLQMQAYSDVPISEIEPGGNPGNLPGPGDDSPSRLRFHDYDFSLVHMYSDLEYTETRATLGVQYQATPNIGIFGSATLYDLDDQAPYLQDATGRVELYSGGLTWMF